MQEKDLNFKSVQFDPFQGPEIEKVVPLIEPQAEIWAACQIGSDDANRSYNESVSLTLTGSLDFIAMEQSIAEIVARHETLRSGPSADGQQLCIFKTSFPEYNFEDLSGLSQTNRDQRISGFLSQNAQTAFDLINGPLFRINLFKLDDLQHHLTLTTHHIICDGWSMGIVIKDLGTLYSAYKKNDQPNLPESPSFADYALKHRKFLQSEEYDTTERYWLEQFKGPVPVLDIPTDFVRPALRTYKSRRDDFQLDPELVAKTKKLGASVGSSFVTTLIVAFETLLYRLSGQKEIILGIPSAGQSTEGNYGLVGHCANLLPIRSHHQGDSTFKEFLQLRKSKIFEAYENREFTFGTLLKKLNIARDGSRVPLVPIVFNSDIGLDDGISFDGLNLDLDVNKREFENFEIFLNASGSEESLILEWSYNTQLFKPDRIKGMMADFESILLEVTEKPEIKIKDIQLASAAEQHDWNITDEDYPKDTPLHELIDQIALRYPDKIALSFKDEQITYKSLIEQCNQLAHVLIKENVSPGDKVGVALDRSATMVISLIAILKVGAVYIPLDPLYPKKSIDYKLSNSGAKVLVTTENYTGKYEVERQIIIGTETRVSDEFSKESPKTGVKGEDLAYIMYTSGSSGMPKGTMISHRNLVNLLFSIKKTPGISSSDRLLAVTTFSFDMAALEIYLPLLSGAELRIADGETVRDGRTLLQALVYHKITIMQATPATWKMMIESGWRKALNVRIFCGGEALSRDLANKLLPLCTELWNMYGPTETTVYSTIKKISGTGEQISIGHPIANTRIFILDQHLKQVPAGTPGEIYIAGDGLAKGYYNLPKLTAENFIDNPFSEREGERIYRTGDLGKFVNDGEIIYLGRIDHQIKIRGYRIEPGEIEHCLNIQDGVKESFVSAVELKNGDQRLVAYIVPEKKILESGANAAGEQSSSTSITEEDLIFSPENVALWKEALKEQLPVHMIPPDFILLKKFPLLPNGKIDRQLLPMPGNLNTRDKKHVLPRTDTEKLIATIWAESLGLESVGVYEDFFELGGHSLIAIQVMMKLEKETGQRLPLATLFNHSTVEAIALLLNMDSKSITWDSLVPIHPDGTKVPLYMVHGAGLNVLIFNALAKQMHPDQPIFGLQAKGLNGIDEPLKRIEEMATHYISEIVNHNPNGPYALAGFSFGGLIAFEMAKQLKALGKEVSMLAMFDTEVSQSYKFKPFPARAINSAKHLINQLLFTFVLLGEDPKRTIEYKTESLKRRFIQLYWKFRYGKNQSQPGFFGYSNKIDQQNEIAAANYIFTPYEGSIELFRAKKKTFYMEDFEYLGWKPFALKGVRIHDIPGEHNYIFAPPNDKEFALVLQKCLDNAVT